MSFSKNIVILTGAGISAESGLKTFRDSEGLWENHRIEDVATPEAFNKNPKLVHQFYNARRSQLKNVQPNQAHFSLAELEKKWKGDFCLITQNVDDLHERAGTKNLLHMHGELKKIRCTNCRLILNWENDLFENTFCNSCNKSNTLRPHIVWFGEIPLHMEVIQNFLLQCDYFVAIGTSGEVYPAAGFVSMVPYSCKTIEINNKDTSISNKFDVHYEGAASQEVVKWMKEEFLLG